MIIYLFLTELELLEIESNTILKIKTKNKKRCYTLLLK